jgi:hypothetical protein
MYDYVCTFVHNYVYEILSLFNQCSAVIVGVYGEIDNQKC